MKWCDEYGVDRGGSGSGGNSRSGGSSCGYGSGGCGLLVALMACAAVVKLW